MATTSDVTRWRNKARVDLDGVCWANSSAVRDVGLLRPDEEAEDAPVLKARLSEARRILFQTVCLIKKVNGTNPQGQRR